MNPAQVVYLVQGVQDSLKKARVNRQMRDGQKTPPAKAESEVDSGLLGRAAVFTQDLGETTKIVTGVVVDSLAGLHFYKVQPDHGMPILGCTSLGSSSNAFMGARSLSTIVPGARVWCLVHPQMEYGVILGCEPDVSVDARNKLSDFIALSSRSGHKVDDAHSFPTLMAKGSGVIDFSTDRPFDGTTAGEWGHITETGLRMFLDPFMAQMAVNEACGVFAFLYDNMLRVAGQNLQIRTSGSELEALNDQGEFTHIEGFAPYPWEHKGGFSVGETLHRDFSAESSQVGQPYYAEREPAHDDQMPFHRVIHTQGYLGQGGKRRVQLPPRKSGVERYSSMDLGPLVFSEDIALTGRYSLRSSKAVSIAKHAPMANFKRMARPETVSPVNGSADSETNYMFAGVAAWSNNVDCTETNCPPECSDGQEGSSPLSEDITATDSSLPVESAANFTNPVPFFVRLASELLKVSKVDADSNILTTSRAFAGTAGGAHSAGTPVTEVEKGKASACSKEPLECFAPINQKIPEHSIKDELGIHPEWPPDSEIPSREQAKALIRAASVMDTHAYAFNMEANHAYFYHKNDWGSGDEIGSPLGPSFQAKINFASLAEKQYLEVPEPIKPDTIDHRYDAEEVEGYYPNESSIDLLEDGGVVIADGFGSEIRMTGGQIFLSAPGDIWLKSGRNTNVWSGQDAIIKAKNSIDITATDKDVRLKSEKNMQLLAGNSEEEVGGILIESRGKEQYEFAPNLGEDVISGGVVIKSSKAPAVILGPSIYARAGLDEGELGDITLDCNQGRGLYKTNSGWQEHFVRHGIWWWFADGVGETVGEVKAAYEFLPTWCSIAGSCGINGHLGINGHKANKGWDLVVDGHYASTACDIYVYCLDGEPLEKTKTFIEEATTGRQALLAGIGESQYELQFTDWWYANKRPGKNETIKKIGVSLRDDTQYLTEEFMIFEDRWQQQARIQDRANSQGGKWKENPVPITATEDREEGLTTYPYPGKKPWKEKTLYVQPDLGFIYPGEESGGLETEPVVRTDPASGPPCCDVLESGMPYKGTLYKGCPKGLEPKARWMFEPYVRETSFKTLDNEYRVITNSEKAEGKPHSGVSDPKKHFQSGASG